MQYNKKDLIKISWDDFEKNIEKIRLSIEKYLKQNNLQIDIMVPILRGGGIPGLRLAFSFKIVRILPYQYKYFYKEGETKLKKLYNPNFSQLVDYHKKNPVILIVEGNHSTGQIAQQVISDIKKELPLSKILYASLAKDYNFKDSVVGADFIIHGFYTNENRKLNKEKCDKLGIGYNKVYIFPWESYEEELTMLNHIDFNYS